MAVEYGPAAGPIDSFRLRGYLDQAITGDQLGRIAKRSIADLGLAARELDPDGLGARLQSFATAQDAGLAHLFHIGTHGGQQFLARHDARFGLFVGFANQHETHDFVLLSLLLAMTSASSTT